MGTADQPDDLRGLLLVGAPRPLLSRAAEERLGVRHREVLDGLEAIVLAEGLSGYTIGDLAARLNCSRRTLYELAPAKDLLLLVVLDRLLHKLGRAAMAAVDPQRPPAEQLRAYLTGGALFSFRSAAFDDLAANADARRLVDRHIRFAGTVIERMVALGVAAGEFRAVNPALVAATVSGSALYLSLPDVADRIGPDLRHIAAEFAETILFGLVADRPAEDPSPGPPARPDPAQSDPA